jgi:hypothetical protein
VKVRVIGVVLNGIRGESTIDFQNYKYSKYHYTSEAEEIEGKNPVVKIRKYLGGLIHKGFV